MLDETQQQSLVTRLNRIEGQVRGIRRMVQEPRVCVELLQQLAAAEAALNRISLAVLRYHVEKVRARRRRPRRARDLQAAVRAGRHLRPLRALALRRHRRTNLIPTPPDRAGRAEMF